VARTVHPLRAELGKIVMRPTHLELDVSSIKAKVEDMNLTI